MVEIWGARIMKAMFKSKRFLAYCVGVVGFVLMMAFTEHTPIESATAITIITGIYIVSESARKSDLG
jgi:uncharacterized membrane protein HdeD (DUF308 family)